MSILLILAMMLTMSACNKENGENSGSSKGDRGSSSSSGAIQTVAEQTGYGFLSTYTDVPGNFDSINSVFVHDGKLYFNAYSYDKVTYEGTNTFGKCNLDGTELTEIKLPESEFDLSVNSFKVDSNGNIWYLMYESYFPEVAEDEGGIDSDFGVAPAEEAAEVTVDSDGASVPVEDADVVVANGMSEETALAIVAGDFSALGENFEYYEAYVLYKCDEQGNVLFRKNLSEEFKGEEDEYIYFYNFAVDGEGYCYLLQDVNLYVLDPNGELSFTLTTTNWFDAVNIAADGTAVVSFYGDNGRELCKIDKAAKDFGESLKFQEASVYYQIIEAGNTGYDFLLNDNNVLYGYDLSTGEKTPILNWLDCDIDGTNTYNFCAIDAENYLTMTYDDAAGKQMMVNMHRVPYDQIPVRTIITYAYTNYMDYNTRSAVLSFNRQNQNYRISTVDYSVYNTEDDYYAGATKLNNDILAGRIPDIIDCSSGVDVPTLAEKGVLLDLYTLIDADSELSRDSFVSGVLSAQELNGKLYTMSNCFSVQTAVGLSNVVGDYPGWTFDEMMAAFEKLPEGASIMRYMTKDAFLTYCLSTAYNNYIDPETGECHFDGEDFVNLLKIANSFPKEYDYYDDDEEYVDDNQLLMEGKILVTQTYLYGFEDFKYQKVYFQDKDYTFVGFPCSTKDGHTLNFSGRMAVSAKSSNTDGVWAFIKTMLTDDYQTNNIWSFPVTQSALDTKKASAMEKPHYTDENGEVVYYDDSFYINGEEMEVQPITEEDIAKIEAVISNNSGTYTTNETVNSIITEEAAYFFDGQKTAEDVANLIQNRVQTYIMEQR